MAQTRLASYDHRVSGYTAGDRLAVKDRDRLDNEIQPTLLLRLGVDVATVEPLTHDLVERFLRKRNTRFMTDSDGDFKIEYTRDEDSGVEITIWIIFNGKVKDKLQFRGSADKQIGRVRWSEAISLCNEWNRIRLFPKAYLNTRNDGSDEVAGLVCELNLDLSAGTFEEFVQDQYTLAVASTAWFFEWLHKEKRFI
jgi:hypothetical protein